jgi:hypothetical protein
LFWDIIPCSLFKVSWHFAGTYYPCSLPASHRVFAFLVLWPQRWRWCEFLQNINWLSTDYMSLYPRSQNSSYPCSVVSCTPYISMLKIETAWTSGVLIHICQSTNYHILEESNIVLICMRISDRNTIFIFNSLYKLSIYLWTKLIQYDGNKLSDDKIGANSQNVVYIKYTSDNEPCTI